ncbi:MAG: hypothetical protein AAFP26_05210 [Planctomycetota bacterium]
MTGPRVRDIPHPARLVVEIEPDHAAPADPAVEAAWDQRRAANPRLFNGPVLAWASDPLAFDGRTVRARRDEYRRLAVQPDIATGVMQLSVTGVVIAPDHAGRPYVCLARRAPSTRIYGGLWELAPSGGVDPPPAGDRTLDAADLFAQLMLELTEELGLAIEPDPGTPICVVTDPVAMSADVVIRVDAVRPVEELVAGADASPRASRWEYDAVRWIAVDEVGAFVRAAGREAVIPPTLDVLEHLGWIGAPSAG